MKPILFNTEMVQAILDERKGATRRVIKPKYSNTHFEFRTDKYGTEFVEIQNEVEGETFGKNPDGTNWFKLKGYIVPKSPFKVGDILYVQETWKIHALNPSSYCMMITYKADGYKELQVNFTPSRYDKFEKFYHKNGWQSPYFMPKEAARIFLRVTGVKLERLRAMNVNDFLQEGICLLPQTFTSAIDSVIAHAEQFRAIWDSTIKKQDLDLYGWNANPWVRAIEFERITKEEAMRSEQTS
ncbi:MAG: hypothetical protein E7234_06060 [Lachnospiraceae bacterium]|nr:hypothetical protein [Lachnospiraceae bacterium]